MAGSALGWPILSACTDSRNEGTSRARQASRWVGGVGRVSRLAACALNGVPEHLSAEARSAEGTGSDRSGDERSDGPRWTGLAGKSRLQIIVGA